MNTSMRITGGLIQIAEGKILSSSADLFNSLVL